MESKQNEITRPLANFRPSIWGDQFLVYHEEEEQADVTQMIESMKEEVRNEILGVLNNVTKHTYLLTLINDIQRLGIAYCFEVEIDQALHHIYTMYGDNWNGERVSLWFRLLRQQGYYVSCDNFNKYKDNEGSFKESLTSSVQAILELYEATYMRVQGEVLLDDALVFTTKQLQEVVKDPLRWNCTVSLSKHIQEALERPIWKRLPRLDALRYIPFYEQQHLHNESILKLAKLDFNRLQYLHKKELSQLSRWWKSFDPPKNLYYVRDRLVELYFWILGVYFEPQYSRSRIFLTKMIKIATILDDTYDSYGTNEELEILSEAIQRWSSTCMDTLPDNLKLTYKIILDCYNEIKDVMGSEGKAYQADYVKESRGSIGAPPIVIYTPPNPKQVLYCGTSKRVIEDPTGMGGTQKVSSEGFCVGASSGTFFLCHSFLQGSSKVKELSKYYMIEARWRNEGYIPTTEEHESVSFITAGYKMLTTSSFISMGSVVTEESFKWAQTNPPIVKAAGAISRLMDDIVDHKVEQQRSHVVSSLASYMKEHDVTEEYVYDLYKKRVEDAWKDINRELLTCKDIPMALKMRVINLARVIEVIYKYDDTLKNVGEEMIHNIKSFLVHAMRV